MTKAKIINKNVDLNVLKKTKDVELNTACQRAIGATFQSNIVIDSTTKSHVYGIDYLDQQNMSQKLILLANNRSMIDVEFKVKGENIFPKHTREEFVAVVTEIGMHIEKQRIKLGNLRVLLEEAKNEIEVLAINWDSI